MLLKTLFIGSVCLSLYWYNKYQELLIENKRLEKKLTENKMVKLEKILEENITDWNLT